MRPRSVMPQDRPAQPTHPSWHPRSGLTGTHGTGGSRRWQGQGRRGGEARACSLCSRTVPRALHDRAQGLDVVDLSVAQILALMEARGIEAAQLAAVSSKQEQLAACFANDRQASARWRDHRLVDARERHPAQRGPHPCGFVRGTRSSSGREHFPRMECSFARTRDSAERGSRSEREHRDRIRGPSLCLEDRKIPFYFFIDS